jgi:TPR repeat protein
MMYDKGLGVLQDYKTAVQWWTLAAEQGNADAQYNLGLSYYKGEGIPQDDKIAVKWYTLAAEQGFADAQHNLGVMYAVGEGVIQNFVYAHMWGNIAASNGHETGDELRDIVAEEMTASQIEEAEKLARECIRKKYKGC